MSDTNPDFDDADSEFEDEDEHPCTYGAETCLIMEAQDELEKLEGKPRTWQRVVYRLKRLFVPSFRAIVMDLEGAIACQVTDHCMMHCVARACWQKKEPDHPFSNAPYLSDAAGNPIPGNTKQGNIGSNEPEKR